MGEIHTRPVIHHFYHAYADGSWREPLTEHLTALREHGLMDSLATFQVGVVGGEASRREVISLLDDATIIAEADEGWEQVTLFKLRDFARDNDGVYFYAHTKSAANPTDINIGWRKSMTYYNVVRWQDALSHLAEHDAVGCHWLGRFDNPIFGGNYWWANARHIRSLPEPKMISRYHAETWVGLSPSMTVYDMNVGWPAHHLFRTEW